VAGASCDRFVKSPPIAAEQYSSQTCSDLMQVNPTFYVLLWNYLFERVLCENRAAAVANAATGALPDAVEG